MASSLQVEPMTTVQDFTPDEQRLIMSSLEAAAVVVSAASPGRKEQTASEGFAVAEFILDSLKDQVANPLVTSTIIALQERIERGEPFPDYVELASRPGAREQAEGILRAAAALLSVKAPPNEAFGFKQWLVRIAMTAAWAGKEDQGFLGRGGILVNDMERAAVQQVATTLGVPSPLDAEGAAPR
jgi:hypothetical protein